MPLAVASTAIARMMLGAIQARARLIFITTYLRDGINTDVSLLIG